MPNEQAMHVGQPPVPPGVYDANVDEMTHGCLVVLAEVRTRLVSRYAWSPVDTALITGVIDEYAAEVADVTEED